MSFFQHLGTFFRTSIYSTSNTTTTTTSSTTCPRTPLTPSSPSFNGVPLDRNEINHEGQLPVYAGLERYILLEKLGDGAFSDVYKALDQQTQEKVAIKIIRKLELNTGQRSRVLREAQLMRSLQHDSIISLYDFMETNNFYFLILELCEGGELFHQIVHLTYFSEDLARHCIWQIAEAIRYLHEEKGVVHRDIKPENLLFSPIPLIESNGRTQSLQPQDDGDDEPKVDEGGFLPNYGGGGIGKVKLADFGLSKVIWDEQAKTPCGTLAYTAPEIIRNERYSKSVDMWALGCVLYTMLCGFPPFYDEAVDVLTEQVARGQYEFLSPWWDFISDGAKDLITHVLCLDPNDRYDIHQFMQHPWMTKQAPSSNGRPLNITGTLILPSSTTTSVAKENIAATKSQHIQDTGDLTTASVSSMKDIINISYRVHRQFEERALRKEHQKRRGLFDYSFKAVILGTNIESDTDGEDGDIEDEDDDDDDSDYDYSIDNTPRDSLVLPNKESAPEKHQHLHYGQQQQQQDKGMPNSSNSNSGTFDLGCSSDEITLVPTLLSTDQSKEATRKSKKCHHRSKALSFELDLDKASLLERRKKLPGFVFNLTAGSD